MLNMFCCARKKNKRTELILGYPEVFTQQNDSQFIKWLQKQRTDNSDLDFEEYINLKILENDRTYLHFAVENNYLYAVEQLVRAGANIHQKDSFEISPFDYASIKDLVDIHNFFLEYQRENEIIPIKTGLYR